MGTEAELWDGRNETNLIFFNKKKKNKGERENKVKKKDIALKIEKADDRKTEKEWEWENKEEFPNKTEKRCRSK